MVVVTAVEEGEEKEKEPKAVLDKEGEEVVAFVYGSSSMQNNVVVSSIACQFFLLNVVINVIFP